MDSRPFHSLPREEQDSLVLQLAQVQDHNRSLPPWDGKDYGIYAHKRKAAGRPSHELENQRGYVT